MTIAAILFMIIGIFTVLVIGITFCLGVLTAVHHRFLKKLIAAFGKTADGIEGFLIWCFHEAYRLVAGRDWHHRHRR